MVDISCDAVSSASSSTRSVGVSMSMGADLRALLSAADLREVRAAVVRVAVFFRVAVFRAAVFRVAVFRVFRVAVFRVAVFRAGEALRAPATLRADVLRVVVFFGAARRCTTSASRRTSRSSRVTALSAEVRRRARLPSCSALTTSLMASRTPPAGPDRFRACVRDRGDLAAVALLRAVMSAHSHA